MSSSEARPISAAAAVSTLPWPSTWTSASGQALPQPLLEAARRVAPEVAVGVLGVHPHDARHGDEQRPVGTQGPEDVLERRALVLEQVERLDQQDAVVGLRRQRARNAQVGDDRRVRVGGVQVHDVAGADAAGPEPARVARVTDLEYVAADRSGGLVQEALDVEAVDRPAAVEAVARAERPRAAQGPPLGTATRRAAGDRRQGGDEPQDRAAEAPAHPGEAHRAASRALWPSPARNATAVTASDSTIAAAPRAG